MPNTFADLDKLITLRTALVVVETLEETRLLHHLAELARQRNIALYTWDAANALSCVTHITHVPRCETLNEALAHAKSEIADGIVVVLDPQPHLKDPAVERQLKEIGEDNQGKDRVVILVGDHLDLPNDLRRLVTYYAPPPARHRADPGDLLRRGLQVAQRRPWPQVHEAWRHGRQAHSAPLGPE